MWDKKVGSKALSQGAGSTLLLFHGVPPGKLFCSGLSFLICRIQVQTGELCGVHKNKAGRSGAQRGSPPPCPRHSFWLSLQASLRGTPWAAPHYWQMALATPRSWAAPGERGTVPWVAPRPTGSCRLTRLSPARAVRRARAAPSLLPPRSLSRRRKVSALLLPMTGLQSQLPQGMTQQQHPHPASGHKCSPSRMLTPPDLSLWVREEPRFNKPSRESDARLKSENFAKVIR